VTVDRHLVQSTPSGNLETSLARIGSTNAAATFGRPAMRACGLLVARPRLLDQRLRRRPSRLRARGGSSTLDFSADPGRVGHRRGRCPTSAASTVPLPKLFC